MSQPFFSETIFNRYILLLIYIFNCRNIQRSVACLKSLCRNSDIIALQETWLLPHDIDFLGSIDNDFAFTGKSAVDTSQGILRGRPYGGVTLLWRKTAFPRVSVVECQCACGGY